MMLYVDRDTHQLTAEGPNTYEVPEPPDYLTRWMWSSELRAFAKVLTLAEAKADRRRLVNARRTLAENAGCATPVGRVDTGPDSQRKATATAVMAMLAQQTGTAFSVEWTRENDTDADLDATGMITVAVAMGLYVGACHARARALKAEIDAAETTADVAAVNIDDNWPS